MKQYNFHLIPFFKILNPCPTGSFLIFFLYQVAKKERSVVQYCTALCTPYLWKVVQGSLLDYKEWCQEIQNSLPLTATCQENKIFSMLVNKENKRRAFIHVIFKKTVTATLEQNILNRINLFFAANYCSKIINTSCLIFWPDKNIVQLGKALSQKRSNS